MDKVVKSETSNDYPEVLKWNCDDTIRRVRVIVCKHGIQWIIQHQAKAGHWINQSFCRTRSALESLLPLKVKDIRATLPEHCS